MFVAQASVGLFTLAQPMAGQALPEVFRSWLPPLQGVLTSAPPVELRVRPILDGSFQRAAAEWLARHVVQRATIVRVYNELLWQTFGTSYMTNRRLVLGKHGTLYEERYITAYCGIANVTDVAALPEFARRLHSAEVWFRKRGHRFVYYSAPVKTSWFPDHIPADFPCPAAKRDQVRPAVATAFRLGGVDYVDGRAALEAERGRVPFELFPRNGIHWNWLGAAIGVDALLQKLYELGVRVSPNLTYEVSVEDDETGTDRDLADLLNLLWQPEAAPAPRIVVKQRAVPQGALRLVTINDSFFEYLPIKLLDAGHIFRSEAIFGYMTLDQRFYEDGKQMAVKADEANIMHAVLDADVVVLEEVESRVGGPYALRFLELVEAEMARDGSSDSVVPNPGNQNPTPHAGAAAQGAR
jgi:alginate O-acetyltransferase complex protein AlgJ